MRRKWYKNPEIKRATNPIHTMVLLYESAKLYGLKRLNVTSYQAI